MAGGPECSPDFLQIHTPGCGEGVRKPGQVGVKRVFPEGGVSQRGPRGIGVSTGFSLALKEFEWRGGVTEGGAKAVANPVRS